MTHFEKRRGKSGFMITFFILFFMAAAGAAAWLGFFLFSPTQKFSEEQVEISIEPPPTIIAGTESVYRLSIKNTSRLPLATTQVSLSVPNGFVITHTTPGALSEKNERWLIGAMDANETRTIELTALWGGAPGTTGNLRAITTFRPSNFNADFEKISDTNITVAGAPINITLTAGTRNENDVITVTTENTSDNDFLDAHLVVALPGFQSSSTEPKALTQTGLATFEKIGLAAHSKKSFVIIGKISDATKPATARVEQIVTTKTVVIAEIGNDPKTAPTITTTAPSSSPTITLTRAATTPIKPGEAVDLLITFVNSGKTVLTDTTIVFTAETPSVKNKSVFDYNNLNTNGSPDVVGKQLSPTVRRATITWTPKNYPDLANIAAGATLTIPLRLTAKQVSVLGETPKETNSTFKLVADSGAQVFTAPPFELVLAPEYAVAPAAVGPAQ